MKKFIATLLTLFCLCTTPHAAVTASGTLEFEDFKHAANINSPTVYNGFLFSNGWFGSPEASIADKYLALNLGAQARGTTVMRQDFTPFFLDSFTYWSRGGDGGVAYLVLYNGSQTVYNGFALGEKLRLTPSHVTFDVSDVYSGKITGFAFAFKRSGGGLGDSSDANRFGFDNLTFSGAHVPVTVPTVPEPAPMLLLASGLLMLVFKARRVSPRNATAIS